MTKYKTENAITEGFGENLKESEMENPLTGIGYFAFSVLPKCGVSQPIIHGGNDLQKADFLCGTIKTRSRETPEAETTCKRKKQAWYNKGTVKGNTQGGNDLQEKKTGVVQ